MRKRNKNNKIPITPNTGVIIGVTGGIGSGKSYVLECFANLGFAVFDTDQAVHDLLLVGNIGYKEIAKIFPDAVGSKAIDRRKLGALAFHNQKVLRQIEAIILPLVRKTQQDFYDALRGKSVVFEVPMLLENKREDYYDYIMVTHSPLEVRKRRALRRKHMTLAKFNAIVASQVSEQIRLKKADYIIDTATTKAGTFKKIKELIDGAIPRNSIRY
ncbi:MAG: dephospho-CoA kinase [Rickettsiales bacterium]